MASHAVAPFDLHAALARGLGVVVRLRHLPQQLAALRRAGALDRIVRRRHRVVVVVVEVVFEIAHHRARLAEQPLVGDRLGARRGQQVRDAATDRSGYGAAIELRETSDFVPTRSSHDRRAWRSPPLTPGEAIGAELDRGRSAGPASDCVDVHRARSECCGGDPQGAAKIAGVDRDGPEIDARFCRLSGSSTTPSSRFV
jgi:hypothetical protein